MKKKNTTENKNLLNKKFIKKETKVFVQKYSSSFVFGIIFGLILGIIFSIIDNLIFLLAEEGLTKILEKNFHNRNIIGIIEGSISSAVAFLIASYFEKKIYSRNKNIIKHPLIDFLGILIGGSIVIILYYLCVVIFKLK
jgi:uncharacterized protein YacL